MSERTFSGACPVRQRDGDGDVVGRCWRPTYNGRCSTHGDVKDALRRFSDTKQLTDETSLPREWLQRAQLEIDSAILDSPATAARKRRDR